MIKYLIKKLVLVLIIAFTFLSVNVVFSKEIVEDERPDISGELINMYNSFTAEEEKEFKEAIDKNIEDSWQPMMKIKLERYVRARQMLDSKYDKNGLFVISNKNYILQDIYNPYRTAIFTYLLINYIYDEYFIRDYYDEEKDEYISIRDTMSLEDFVKNIKASNVLLYVKNHQYVFDYFNELYYKSVVMKKEVSEINTINYYFAVDTDKMKNKENGISDDLKVELETIKESYDVLTDKEINNFAKFLLSKNFEQ